MTFVTHTHLCRACASSYSPSDLPLGTQPATSHGSSENLSSFRIPEWPANKLFQVLTEPTPKGLTVPIPVTTTRRSAIYNNQIDKVFGLISRSNQRKHKQSWGSKSKPINLSDVLQRSQLLADSPLWTAFMWSVPKNVCLSLSLVLVAGYSRVLLQDLQMRCPRVFLFFFHFFFSPLFSLFSSPLSFSSHFF